MRTLSHRKVPPRCSWTIAGQRAVDAAHAVFKGREPLVTRGAERPAFERDAVRLRRSRSRLVRQLTHRCPQARAPRRACKQRAEKIQIRKKRFFEFLTRESTSESVGVGGSHPSAMTEEVRALPMTFTVPEYAQLGDMLNIMTQVGGFEVPVPENAKPGKELEVFVPVQADVWKPHEGTTLVCAFVQVRRDGIEVAPPPAPAKKKKLIDGVSPRRLGTLFGGDNFKSPTRSPRSAPPSSDKSNPSPLHTAEPDPEGLPEDTDASVIELAMANAIVEAALLDAKAVEQAERLQRRCTFTFGPGSLGVTFKDAAGSIIVKEVTVGSQAAQQGAVVGSELISVAGKPIKGVAFMALMGLIKEEMKSASETPMTMELESAEYAERAEINDLGRSLAAAAVSEAISKDEARRNAETEKNSSSKKEGGLPVWLGGGLPGGSPLGFILQPILKPFEMGCLGRSSKLPKLELGEKPPEEP